MSLITPKDVEHHKIVYGACVDAQFCHHQSKPPTYQYPESSGDYRERQRQYARDGLFLQMKTDAAELHLRAALIMLDQVNIGDVEARQLAATLMSRTVVEE